MKFLKYTFGLILIVSVIGVGWMLWQKGHSDYIRNFNYEKDFAKVDALFHKEDNWYWMVSDYGRKHSYDLDDTFRNRISSEGVRGKLVVKVLDIDDKLAGLVAYNPKSLYAWQILFLIVDQDFRGRGISKKLMKYAMDDILRSSSVIRIDTLTRVDNARSQGLYKGLGFKQTRKTEEHVYFSWYKN